MRKDRRRPYTLAAADVKLPPLTVSVPTAAAAAAVVVA